MSQLLAETPVHDDTSLRMGKIGRIVRQFFFAATESIPGMAYPKQFRLPTGANRKRKYLTPNFSLAKAHRHPVTLAL
jgi:hypothetical protein